MAAINVREKHVTQNGGVFLLCTRRYHNNGSISFENKVTKHISLNDDITLKMDQNWKPGLVL